MLNNSKSQTAKQEHKRVEWIDVAKFFGIVLVFIAHGVFLEETNLFRCLYRGVIYTFHMPLFFILSMMTVSLSDSIDSFIKKTKRRAVHLLIPFFVLWVIFTLIDVLYVKVDSTDKNWWVANFYRLIGVEYADILNSGPAWFFIALFVGQTVFDFLHLTLKNDSILFVAACFLTAVGVLLGFASVRLPFALDMTLASLIFFFVGYKLKQYDFSKKQFTRFLVLLTIWVVSLLLTFPNFYNPTYYEALFRRYPLFPICIICSISGTMVFLYLIKWFCKIPFLYKPFAFLGRWTLVIFMIHAVDEFYFGYWFNFFPDNFHLTNYLGGLLGLGMSLIIIGAIYLIKFLRKRNIKAE